MDSKKLEILVTAADLGSFTRASEVVGYTQSGLTHMMDTLEREIGLPLLRRTHSGIQLTEYGTKLMPEIRAFLRANANLENQIAALKEQAKTTIRMQPTPAWPCTGCRRFCTGSGACARMWMWTCAWWTTRWSPSSCWTRVRPM